MRALLAVAGIAACLTAGSASAAAPTQQPPPPTPDARAWIVENPATGEVLASHDARLKVPIASITKLMTVLVALEHLKLTDVVTVDARAAAVGQESLYLSAGQELTVADLVKSALIQSANDAADALALAVAPSFPDFARLMNAKARELGLTDSSFVRPDGLDAPGEYASARDVTTLAIEAMKLPAVRGAVRLQSFTIADGSVLSTWNDLLGTFPGVFGVKTGHTSAAGWSMVAAARGGGTTVYATILGSPSRTQRNADLAELIAYGLAQYRTVNAIATGRDYATVTLPYGRAPLPLVAPAAFTAVVRVNEPLTERVVAPAVVSLPVSKGQVLGTVQVFARGKLIGRRPLVASRSVAKPGTAARVGWYAGRTVHDAVGLFK